MPGSVSQWDVILGGTGYMLTDLGPVDATGGVRPGLAREQLQYPAARQAAGGQGYEHWPVEIETPWVIDDESLQSGFGQRTWREYAKRFYYAFCDTRIPGKIFRPPQLNSQTITAEERIFDQFYRSISGTNYQYITSGRYVQYWTSDPTSVSNSKDFGTGKIMKSAANFQGAHDEILTFVSVNEAAGQPRPYQTFSGETTTSTWAEDAQTKTVAPNVVTFDDNGTPTHDAAVPMAIVLNSLVAAQDYLLAGASQPFEGLEVTMTNPNGSASVITIEYWNGSAWTAVSGGSDGTTTGGASFGQTGDITWTLPSDWAVYEAYSQRAWYWIRLSFSGNFDSSVGTTDIDLIQRDTAEFFAVHDELLYCVRKEADGYILYSTALGGTDAAWVEVETITDLENPVTGMLSAGSRLYVFTETVPHVLADDGASIGQEVWPHPRTLRDTNNGVGASEWRNGAWVPSRRDLYHFSDDRGYIEINDQIGPGRLLDNDSPVSGRVTCFAGDDYFGYATIRNENDSKSYLISYDLNEGAWHSLLDLGNITPRKMWVSDVGHADNPLLYFNAGDDTRWIILPRHGPDPSATGSGCRFDAATTGVGQIYFGRFYSRFIFEVLAFHTGKIIADDVSSSDTIIFEYRTIDGGTWNTLITMDTESFDSVDFAASVSGRFIEVRATIGGTTVTATPILRYLFTSFAVRFPAKKSFPLAIAISDQQADRNGNQRQETARDLINSLETSVDASAPIILQIPDLDTSWSVLSRDYRLFDVASKGQVPREWVAFSEWTQRAAAATGTWNNGATYTWNDWAAFDWGTVATL
jgi:hypothetical protein